ncbi:ATP-binding protein [uncultured Fibrella sp.]|uniref:ATP-binding protein n=1 Tax=uncultured Fibrella sp. TaxID=1284596 RepID=UPI0035CC35F4
MIQRQLTRKLLQLAQQYPVITLTGPRQSGKSTLVQSAFPDLPYVLLEDPDIRTLAQTDPRGFLANYANGAIFDEVQRVPDLFAYLQGIVDRQTAQRPFILTGSQNFLLLESINQSLAGRTAVLRLLPLSYEEQSQNGLLPSTPDELLVQGSYPRLVTRHLAPADFYPSYIQTYLERDVRSLKNIADLSKFTRFLRLCAGRIGSALNLSSLANDCGVSVNTAKAWMSVLEASYVVYLLPPHYENFSKRLIKSPKLYFYDTGLVCSLLGLRRADLLESFYMRGNLFENLVVSEVLKHAYNQGQLANCYYWQDKTGREVDLLIETELGLLPIEIKAGMTLNKDYFDQLTYWNKLSGNPSANSYVVYGGNTLQSTSSGTFVPLSGLARLLTGNLHTGTGYA